MPPKGPKSDLETPQCCLGHVVSQLAPKLRTRGRFHRHFCRQAFQFRRGRNRWRSSRRSVTVCTFAAIPLSQPSSRISLSTSLPQTSQPGADCRAKSSIRGTSPIRATILFLTSSGFLLCTVRSASRSCLMFLEIRRGFPCLASRQTSTLPIVQRPRLLSRHAVTSTCTATNKQRTNASGWQRIVMARARSRRDAGHRVTPADIVKAQ
jgi:hypothetical protein